MKKFTFPLERVMDFRRTQVRLEEIKLETLYAGLRAMDTREAALLQKRVQSEKELKSAASVSGDELQTFNAYSLALGEEIKRMEKTRIECRRRIETQQALLTTKRREFKLLEKLKEQRFEKWEKEMFKEIDSQAEEAYLAKWNTR